MFMVINHKWHSPTYMLHGASDFHRFANPSTNEHSITQSNSLVDSDRISTNLCIVHRTLETNESSVSTPYKINV